MSKLIKWMDETFYPGADYNWDNVLFRKYLLEHIESAHTCLEFGAGRGNVKEMDFHGGGRRICGVDIDEAVFQNEYLDDARLIDPADCIIPYEDETFDIVYSDNVLEHVEKPEVVFGEISRVLKPGGKFISKTPNKWHYVPLAAMVTPTAFHKYYNKCRGRRSHDTFPTFYRCNSKSKLIGLAAGAGLSVEEVQYWEGRPEYLRLSTLTYMLGYLYERAVNYANILSGLRAVLVFELRKGKQGA